MALPGIPGGSKTGYTVYERSKVGTSEQFQQLMKKMIEQAWK